MLRLDGPNQRDVVLAFTSDLEQVWTDDHLQEVLRSDFILICETITCCNRGKVHDDLVVD